MKLAIKLAAAVISLLIVEYLLPGVELTDLTAAVVAAVSIGVVNAFIKPIVKILTLPITILTLGLFALLVNILLLWGVAYFVPGFTIDGFLTALLASILLSIVTSFFNQLLD